MPDTFTPIHNDVLEALMKIRLSPSESSIVLAVWRKTYGFTRGRVERQKFTYLGVQQIMNMTDLSETSVHRALRSLIVKGIICRNGAKTGFCKAFMRPKGATSGSASSDRVPVLTVKGASSGRVGVPVLAPIKETSKENIKEKPKNEKAGKPTSHSILPPEIEKEFSEVYARLLTNDDKATMMRDQWPKQKREYFNWWLSNRIFYGN